MAGFYLLLAGGFWPLMGLRCQVSGFRIDKSEFSDGQTLNTDT